MTQDRRLFFKINRVQKVLFKHVEKEMRKRLGITPVQLGVLFYLIKNDGCQLKAVSIEMGQNNSATTTLVERMERNGLLTKKASRTDGRSFQVFITEKGRRIADMGVPMISEFNERLTDKVTEAEVESVHNFLDKVIAGFKEL